MAGDYNFYHSIRCAIGPEMHGRLGNRRDNVAIGMSGL